jgi:hypothetical protein
MLLGFLIYGGYVQKAAFVRVIVSGRLAQPTAFL